MGYWNLRLWDGVQRARRLSRTLLRRDATNMVKHECEVLVLGSNGSGKSTVMKHMKILHINGYSDDELSTFRHLIWRNHWECVQAVVRGLAKLGLEPVQPHNKAYLQRLSEYSDMGDGGCCSDYVFIQEAYDLSTDDAITALMEHEFEFNLMESAAYFFENSRRISQKDYVPTTEDILRAREKATTDTTQMHFGEGQFSVHLYEIKGPWSNLTNWIRSLENLTSVVFCAALSDYGQVTLEDGRRVQGQLADSFGLFASIINSLWFRDASIVLYLTKIDVLERKVLKVPMKEYFPEFTGGSDINSAAKFILWEFMQTNNARPSVYPHILYLTGTVVSRMIMVVVRETVLQMNMRKRWRICDLF